MFGAELAGIGPLAFGVLPTSAQPYLPGFHIATWLNGSSRIRRLGGLGRYPRDVIASVLSQKKKTKRYIHTSSKTRMIRMYAKDFSLPVRSLVTNGLSWGFADMTGMLEEETNGFRSLIGCSSCARYFCWFIMTLMAYVFAQANRA